MTNDRTSSLSRRILLGVSFCAPLLAVAGRASAEDGVCIDPDALSDAEISLRESLQFKETAPDPAKPCARCAFFTAHEETPGCGACQLLHGPVRAMSWCSSWAPK